MTETKAWPRKSSHARYEARRKALKAQGKWQPYTPAGPVRDHVRQVIDATGWSCVQFAAAAGIDGRTARNILAGRYPQVRADVAARVMLVTAAAPAPGFGLVSPVGACRRLQALAYAGWPAVVLAARLGMHPRALRKVRDGDREKIYASTAAGITAVYDELWDTPPPQETPAEKVAATKTRAHAARQGWLPWGAWDDDTIDDEAAQPAGGWQRRRRLTVAETAAEARELLGMGLRLAEVVERLGVAERTVTRALAVYPAMQAGEAA